MSDDDIDMDRVITDPQYRQEVIEFLNASEFAVTSRPDEEQSRQAKTVG
jgi:hypothetical protein